MEFLCFSGNQAHNNLLNPFFLFSHSRKSLMENKVGKNQRHQLVRFWIAVQHFYATYSKNIGLLLMAVIALAPSTTWKLLNLKIMQRRIALWWIENMKSYAFPTFHFLKFHKLCNSGEKNPISTPRTKLKSNHSFKKNHLTSIPSSCFKIH